MRRTDICSWQAASISSAFKVISFSAVASLPEHLSQPLWCCTEPIQMPCLGFWVFPLLQSPPGIPQGNSVPLDRFFSSPVFAPLGFGWDLSPCSGLLRHTIYIAYIYQRLEGGHMQGLGAAGVASSLTQLIHLGEGMPHHPGGAEPLPAGTGRAGGSPPRDHPLFRTSIM